VGAAPESSAEVAFQSFMADYSKNYPTTEEYSMRFELFKENLEFVESHPEASFKVGINSMFDWTPEEYANISGTSHERKRMAQRVGSGTKVLPETNLPKEVDWRRTGVVTTAVH
jgi:hypothetical protein